mmetsp:Transcript_32963/g.70700  ORF Transcript_32963/g.70700 Transcript_32963/m.70700 type:complete len:218 (-) Transcript_32963:48-701(-)
MMMMMMMKSSASTGEGRLAGQKVRDSIVVQLQDRACHCKVAFLLLDFEELRSEAHGDAGLLLGPVHRVRLACSSLPVGYHGDIVAIHQGLSEALTLQEDLLLRPWTEDGIEVVAIGMASSHLDHSAVDRPDHLGVPCFPLVLVQGAQATIHTDLPLQVLNEIVHLATQGLCSMHFFLRKFCLLGLDDGRGEGIPGGPEPLSERDGGRGALRVGLGSR